MIRKKTSLFSEVFFWDTKEIDFKTTREFLRQCG